MTTLEIPNHIVALHPSQAEWDSKDIQIILDALRGTSVRSGCSVSPQTTPDGSVLVGSGTYKLEGSGALLNCAGGSVSVVSGSTNPDGSTPLAADANWDRFDLIVLNVDQELGVVHGVTSPPTFLNGVINKPVFPAYTGLALAAVHVTPGLTAIITGRRVPKGVLADEDAFHDRLHLLNSIVNHAGEISNAQHGIRSVASAHGASQIVFTPVGSIAATDVQAAIAEMLAEYERVVPFTHTGNAVAAAGPVRWYNRTGRTLTIAEVFATANTAPAGSVASPIAGAGLVFDVNVNGTSIWSTQANRVNIQSAAFTGVQTTFNTPTLTAGQYLQVDTDYIGSTTPGADIDVHVLLKG